MNPIGAIVVASGLAAAAALPIDPDTLVRPDWRVGDRWVYQRSSEPDGKNDGWSREIVALRADRGFEVKFDREIRQVDGDGNRINAPGSDFSPRWYRWPARPGDEWTYMMQIAMVAGSGSEVVRRRVVGWEPITVPAGYFRCLRIDSTRVRMTSDGRKVDMANSSTQVDMVTWFCPEVRGMGREEAYYRSGTGRTWRVTSELATFRSGRADARSNPLAPQTR